MLRTAGPETICNEVKCFGGFNLLHQYINGLSIGNSGKRKKELQE